MSLYNLPDELLLIIFNYCDAHDIIQLNCVCKRFYGFVSKFLMKELNLLVTGEMAEKFRERCQPLLSSYSKKFYIHNNWICGKYESKIFYPKSVSNRDRYNRNFLQITKDVILLASDMKSTNNLCAFNRTKNGSVSKDNVIVANCSTEILDIFVPRNDIIVTHHRNGSIRQWTIDSLDGKKYFNEKLLRSSRPYAYNDYYMDVTPQSIVTGAHTGGIEIWKYIPEENSIMNKYIPDLNLNPTLKLHARFITFDSTGTKFATIISDITQSDGRVLIYDLNKRCTEIYIGAKDLDLNLWHAEQMLWNKPNDILYLIKNNVVKMDVRTHKLVKKWKNPFDYFMGNSFDCGRFRCMSTDNQYAIITGTSHGKVILWDQRQSDFIQTYDKDNVDCVDCLQFDSSRMYVAADKLYEYDFTKI